jgi:hypothetical protein
MNYMIDYDAKLISKIDELIYYQNEQWLFPGKDNLKKYLERSLEREIPEYFFIIANKIVDELNNKNVSIDDYEVEFPKILKIVLSK